jgi:hypothetical protein
MADSPQLSLGLNPAYRLFSHGKAFGGVDLNRSAPGAIRTKVSWPVGGGGLVGAFASTPWRASASPDDDFKILRQRLENLQR